jgi:CRP-like cAMP-binding protein
MALDKAKIREEVQRLINSKNWNKALEELQKLVILEARDPEIRIKIGDVHLMMENKVKAIEEYKKAMKLLEKSGGSSAIVPLCQKILEIDSYQDDVKETLQRFQAQPPAKEKEEVVLKEEMAPIPLFSDLSENEFKRVLAKAQAKKFSSEEVIVKEGDKGNSIYFVTSGEAKVFKRSKDEKQVMVDIIKEGNFFGEFGYFGDSKRHASVVAFTDIEVLEMSKEGLEEVIKEFPRVSDVLIEFYKIRILDTLLALSPLFRGIKPPERKKLISRFQLMVAEEGKDIVKEAVYKAIKLSGTKKS